MAVANPIMDIINRGGAQASNTFSAASRALAMADNSFQKGASMALKMDQLLQQQEAKLYNRQQQAQSNLLTTMQRQRDNQFRQQGLEFKAKESARLQGNFELTTQNTEDARDLAQTNYLQKRTDAITSASVTAKAKLKRQGLEDAQWANEFNQTAAKNYQTSMSDIFSEAESIIPADDQFGLKKDAATRLEEVNKAAHEIGIQRGLFKRGSVNPYTNKKPTTKSGAPVTLDAYSKANPDAPTVDNVASARAKDSDFVAPGGTSIEKNSAYLNRQIRTNDENGQKVADKVITEASANPSLVLNPAYQSAYASALISNGDHISQKAWQAANQLPAKERAIVISKAEEMVFDTTTYDSRDGEMRVQVEGNGPAVTQSKNRLKDYNSALSNTSIATVGNYMKQIKGTSLPGALFQDLGSVLGMGLSTTEEVEKTADQMKRSDAIYLRQSNTAPYAITTSMLKDVVAPFFSKAKSFNFGVGLTGSNLDNINAVWDMPAKVNGKTSTLERFVLPTSKDSLGFGDKKEAYTKGRVPKKQALVQNRSDYSDQQNYIKQMGGYDKEAQTALVSNITNITKTISAYQKKNGYKMSDGTFKSAPSSKDMVKIPMVDLQSGETEVVEMSLYGAVILNSVLLQGKLQ